MKKTNEKNMNLIDTKEHCENLRLMYSGELKSMFDKQIAKILDNSIFSGNIVRISQENEFNWNNKLTVFVAPIKPRGEQISWYELNLENKNGVMVTDRDTTGISEYVRVDDVLGKINSVLVEAYNKFSSIHTEILNENRKKMYNGELKAMFDKQIASIIDRSVYNDAVIRISQNNDFDWNNELTVFVVPNRRNWNDVYMVKFTKKNGSFVLNNADRNLYNSNVIEMISLVMKNLELAYDKYSYIHNNGVVVDTKVKNQDDANKDVSVSVENQVDDNQSALVDVLNGIAIVKDSRLNSYKPKVRKKTKVVSNPLLLN